METRAVPLSPVTSSYTLEDRLWEPLLDAANVGLAAADARVAFLREELTDLTTTGTMKIGDKEMDFTYTELRHVFDYSCTIAEGYREAIQVLQKERGL